jgi:hypothetical protein
MITPAIIPILNPKYCRFWSLLLKISATSRNVITGLSVVMITPPEPAKPYFIPKKDETIKAMFKIELPAIYFRFDLFSFRGAFKKYKIGKKDILIIKNRQKTIISIGSSTVSIFKAVQPPPQRNIAKIRRYVK